jgi:hypothetical protein
LNKSRAALWKRIRDEIASTVASLKRRHPIELRSLSPQKSEIREGRRTAAFAVWSETYPPDRVAVLVEAREPRFGGLWHSVAAEGFYVDSDDTIHTMEEKDLWVHGY